MTCSRYKTNYVTKYQCASGWRSHGHTECIYAVCNYHTNPLACKQTAYVMKKLGTSLEKATGSCVSPDRCVGCGMYFYSNGPICTPCPRIDNCSEMRCNDTHSSTICAICDGVKMDLPYHRAYIRSDDMKRCQQACSWRADSTRCYPGYCADGLAANCTCVAGFTGKHCEISNDREGKYSV
uniref:Uncharacterized protein LOC111107531 n=1 Tax=Crassostrea virginica TaxID=6565 RepID=A0A8B8B6Z4_CRAVI|nr:uncharacterized protein LOC111107531 [Crassostrea virginica]